MKRAFVFMFAAVMMLTLSGCGETSERSTPQNELNSVPQIEITSDAVDAPVNNGTGSNEPSQPQSINEPLSESEPKEDENTMTNISIAVGRSIFSVKLYDNNTAKEFVERLPMTLDMSELNGNEKYYYLPESLPSDSQRIGSINAGDLMLYGSDCLVLFYENFTTSYSYTKLGYIEDASGLVDALGRGNAEITFAVSD